MEERRIVDAQDELLAPEADVMPDEPVLPAKIVPAQVSPAKLAPDMAAPAVPDTVPPASGETAESRAEEENRRRRRRRRRGPRRDEASDGLSAVAALGAEQPDLNVLRPQDEPQGEAPPTDPSHALVKEGADEPVPPAATDATAPSVEEHAPVIETESISTVAIETVLAPAEPEPPASQVEVPPHPSESLAEAAEQDPAAVNPTELLAIDPAPAEATAPAVEAAPNEEGGEAKTRRRGRRGGRRRRRDEDEVPAEAEATPALPYIGPTPADPFGKQPFDIFDVMDQVEQARPLPMPTQATEAPQAGNRATDLPVANNGVLPMANNSVLPMANNSVAEENQLAPFPEAEIEAVKISAESSDTARVLPNGLHVPDDMNMPPADAAPMIKPVLINAPAAERKRGWWRR
jgi:ribonuclease E